MLYEDAIERAPVSAAPPQSPAPAPTPGGRPLRVLYVEDDPADAELALRELRRGGLDVEVDVVHGMHELTPRLVAGRYDAVLSDFRLPGFSGLDVLGVMQDRGLDLPFILVTGSLGDEEAVECIKRGMWDYVLKDRLARLPIAIRRALKEKGQREQRMIAELALIDSERRHRLLFEATPLPVLVYDRVGRAILAVNDAAVAHYGYSRAEFLGMSIDRLRPLEDVLGEAPAAASAPGPGDATWRHSRKDGSVITVEVTGHELTFSGRQAELIVVRDVTERKRSEDLIRRLTVAVEQSPATVIITDTDGRIEYVNPKFTEVTGYAPEDVLGQTPRLFKSGRTPPEVYRELWATISAGREWRGELENRRKDGERYWEAVSVSPIRDAAGRVTHYVGIKLDITEQRRLEEQLRQAQKMEAVGRLSGGVAHDFNNLLTVITSYGELLFEDLPEGDPRRDDVQQIRQAAAAAAGLTRQLLAFSRQQVLEPRVIDLNTIVDGAGQMLRRLIGEDVDLVVTLASDLGTVKADPGQVEQVIVNLAVNARDAMPEGGTLTISTANLQQGPKRLVELTLTDSGTGMDEETQARMFEPFFTTKETGKGTGLGLSTVYGIVEQSGGSIHVTSAPGRGTTFRICLPQVEEPVQAVPRLRTPRALRGRETILLAEDAAAVRTVAHRALEQQGYTVLVAADAAAASEVARRHAGPLDLLVTDVVMPQGSGVRLAEQLRQRHPGLKVVFISGYANDTLTPQQALGSGFAFLQKPFTPESLARKVREVLGGG